MGFSLGIDVGTTFTAAATWRDGQVEVLALESHRVAIPSVVFASGDDIAFGTAAVGRAATQPAGAAREFKRRLGDPVPIMLSGAPYSADRLVALIAQWVARSVTEQVGEPPDRVVVTHPANWTEFQLHLLSTALKQVGVGDVGLISEPQAAAIDFGAAARLEPGELVVVYDLGGGTFDVALLRREAVGFAHVGEPAGVERLGGIDFDEAVFQHVIANVSDQVIAEARSDSPGRMALAQLRRASTEAKESLSSEIAVDIPVVLPGATSAVRLTRGEFEEMIRPMLNQTVDLVEQVIVRNGIEVGDLSAVLLVGGSSRIPVVSELVRERLGAPVRVDAHPKLVVARGAARWAGSLPPGGAAPSSSVGTARTGARRRGVIVAAGVAAVAAIGVGAWLVAGGDGEGSGAPESTDEPVTTGRKATTVPATPASSAPTTPQSTAVPATLAPRQSVASAEQIGNLVIPPGTTVDGSPFAGLTGLAVDQTTDGMLALSDAPGGQSDATLFEINVDLADGRLDDGDLTGSSATILRDSDGEVFGSEELDGEALALPSLDSLVVASEGNVQGQLTPAIKEFDREGTYVRDWPLPSWYGPDPDGQSGIPPQGGLNSLAVMSGPAQQLLAGFEFTLLQDEEGADGEDSARILAYDTSSMEPVAEYRYPLDPTAFDYAASDGTLVTSGLLDLVPLDDGRTLLALERSLKEEPITTRLYEVTLDPAVGVTPSPAGPPQALAKRELAEFDVGGTFQSMALGPVLPDGRQSLIVVADHGFSPDRSTVVVAYALDIQERE